jgi:tetratricopeptide (TPR) repeat protein
MAAVTTWTGREANALRQALRMSVTGFAEHLGAARRTVAKWSSQGDKIHLRADMQAALDTVLARATPDVRERFEAVVRAGTSGALADPATLPVTDTHVHTGRGSIHDFDSDGDVRRRDLLTGVTISGIALPSVASLLNALVSPPPRCAESVGLPLRQFARDVAAAKTDYQACRYEQVLAGLVALLPALEPTRADADGDQRAQVEALASDLYHVVGSVLLKVGDKGMALVAAERSTRAAVVSQDPVAMAASARIMTHALMSNGHSNQARQLAENAADTLQRGTRLASTDAVAVYGALLLRGAIAAARDDNRDSAQAMLDEATHAAGRLGYDGNDRWTGFGATNVLLHRVNVALTLGDAGTAIELARQVPLDKIRLAERKASLFVDMTRAYTQWGRYEHGLNALRNAYEVAPEEIRCRPAVQRIASDLAVLTRGQIRTAVVNFAQHAGIRV